jgi:hypothetical protein
MLLQWHPFFYVLGYLPFNIENVYCLKSLSFSAMLAIEISAEGGNNLFRCYTINPLWQLSSSYLIMFQCSFIQLYSIF